MFNSAHDAQAYIRGGKGEITLTSAKTGAHYTYRFRQPRADAPIFVSLLSGPDNESSYTYLASIFDGTHLRLTRASRALADTPSWRALSWTWERLARGVIPSTLTIQHEGACGRCGRKLTHPESIAAGLGPICSNR